MPVRARITVVVVLVLVLCGPTAVAAQAGGETTTVPAPETTVPAPTLAPTPDSSAPAPETTVPTGDGAAPSNPPEQPLDPLAGEAPSEPVPDTEVTVPPPEPDGTEDLWEPARILWSSVEAAEKKLQEAEAARSNTVAAIRDLRKRHKQLTIESQRVGAKATAIAVELTTATDRFRARAVLGFQQFGSGSEEGDTTDFGDYQDVLEGQRRSRMVDSALRFDQSDIDQLTHLRARLDTTGRAVLDRRQVVSDHLVTIESTVTDLDQQIEQALVEYEAFRAGSQIFIHGAVFPIAPGYDTSLIDSWGFPRMVGTPDEHGHQGIDIFAPRGTPLVAAERGVIARLGVGRLGGLKFWLRGESGSDWYYAHLDSFAPDLHNGQVVAAGELLGYVGDTGNAVGTPPHLHLQLHPGGGDPVNPYPLLQVISEIELAAIAEGTFDGYDYEPVVAERPDPPSPLPEPTTTTTTTITVSETRADRGSG